MQQLPDWLLKNDNYIPPAGHNHGFVQKNVLLLLSFLQHVRQKGVLDTNQLSTPLKLMAAFYLIILVSLAHQGVFCLVVWALVSLRLCFVPNKQLREIILPALAAGMLALLVLVPSLLWLPGSRILLLSSKIFLSVTLLRLVTTTTPWNQLTMCLRWFYVPDLIIFTLDITLKYLTILGELCVQVLQAIQLRTVGRLQNNSSLYAGVLGIAFLHAQSLAEDTYKAMQCRCFTGTYARSYHFHWHVYDGPLLVLLVFLTGVFLYFRV